MKVTIEHPHLTATTDSWDIVTALTNILQSGPFAETTPTITKETPADIPADTYLVITTKGIFCDGEPTDTYNGEDIWEPDDSVRYFKDVIRLFKKEHGIDVVELHCLQSSTKGKYAQPGEPVADANGRHSWCRIKLKDGRLSRWVFRYASSSVADCRSNCAPYCGYNVRNDSAFRAGVFGSLGN